MSKILLILNDPPYGSERCHNALRLAGALARRDGHEVRIFLIGDAAACARSHQQVPSGFYNVAVMLKGAGKRGAGIGVCGTCMDARGLADADLAEGSRRSTLEELADWTDWAEEVLVF